MKRKEKKSQAAKNNSIQQDSADMGDENADEDDEDVNGKDGDEDYELRLLREQRLKQIKEAHKQKIENIGKGHGMSIPYSIQVPLRSCWKGNTGRSFRTSSSQR